MSGAAASSLWFGLEWEIGLSATLRDGSAAPTGMLLDCVDEELVRTVQHVNCQSGPRGWWLPNGARFYRDASDSGQAHDEVSSPECSHPDELLRQDLAAERLVLGLAELAAGRKEFGEVRVSKANVCPAAVESFGSHESYETARPVLSGPMQAWLASRIVLTGAGGLDVRYPGIRFTLSPRAHFIEQAENNQTQVGRGLHNTGRGAHYGERHRVHVIAGDGNRARLSTWLRFATTALVVRMFDTGRGWEIVLPDPVGSLRAFALDPECRDQQGPGGRAIDLQRRFLECARECSSELPDWTPRVLAEWQRVLDALDSDQGWRGLIGELDWPTKLALFEKVLARRGWTWERVAEVNRMITGALESVTNVPPTQVETLRDGGALYRGELMRLVGEELQATDLVKDFMELRQQLATVDARYMELGKESLFEQIAVQPAVLANVRLEFPTGDELPLPESGRARIRAELVREFGWKGSRPQQIGDAPSSSWTRFVASDGQILEMPNVDGAFPREWRDEPRPDGGFGPSRTGLSSMALLISRATNISFCANDTGIYQPAAEALAAARAAAFSEDVTRSLKCCYWAQAVRLCGRLQREDEIVEALEQLEQVEPVRMEVLFEAVNSRCWLGLGQHPDVPELARRVEEEMAVADARTSGIACFKSHYASYLNRVCRPAEALRLLESTSDSGEFSATSDSVRCRIRNQMAEAHRMLGNLAGAESLLEEAEQISEAAGLTASRIDFILTARARLLAQQGDSGAAARLLLSAVLPVQRCNEMPNLVRTRILLTRLLPESGIARPDELRILTAEIEGYSGFVSCPLMKKILSNFDDWCDGAPDPEPPQDAELSECLWGV